MNQKQLLFSLNGRIGRAEWWTASVILVLLRICAEFAIETTFGVSSFGEGMTVGVPSPVPATLASFGLALMFIWPHLALNVKRLHDRNISAWPGVVLAVTGLAAGIRELLRGLGHALPGDGGGLSGVIAAALIGLGLLAFGLGVLVILAFLDGTRGPNRYGPSPKGFEAVES